MQRRPTVNAVFVLGLQPEAENPLTSTSQSIYSLIFLSLNTVFHVGGSIK